MTRTHSAATIRTHSEHLSAIAFGLRSVRAVQIEAANLAHDLAKEMPTGSAAQLSAFVSSRRLYAKAGLQSF